MDEEGRETVTGSSKVDQGRAESGGSIADVPAEDASLQSLVVFLAQNLVINPEAVAVTEKRQDDATLYELRVDKADLGRVIGKQGRTAKSLRTILNAAASKAKIKVSLEIVEE
jgi:predicted RNA-binding protein YlqC (UPF0109 family)